MYSTSLDDINNCYRRDYKIIVLAKSIVISKSNIEKLIQHAKTEAPNESCALLIGNEIQDEWRVKEVFLTENVEKSKISFTISPEQELEIDKIARAKNMEIVCVFHSHPNSEAVPSSTDKEFMITNPFPWMIYSVELDTIKTYLLKSTLNEINIKEI